MSNLGLRIAMQQEGITLVETKVGDRYVLEALAAGGFAIGGEQSGHVVLPEFATTGDGLLTALHLMARMAATGSSLAELASVVTKLPQVLINVTVGDRVAGASAPQVRRRSTGCRGSRRDRAGAAASIRDRAAGPGDGRGRHA